MRTYSEKQLVVLQSVIRLMEGGADLREVKASDIAQAAGIGKGSLYLYFSSKEDIILNALLYRLDMQMEQVIALVEREESFREKCRAIFHFCRTLSEGDASAFRLAMKSIGSVEPDQLFDEGRAYFQRRERDIRRVLLETARQGEREGVISPPADEEYILLTFNSIMQGVYRTICAGISVQGSSWRRMPTASWSRRFNRTAKIGKPPAFHPESGRLCW